MRVPSHRLAVSVAGLAAALAVAGCGSSSSGSSGGSGSGGGASTAASSSTGGSSSGGGATVGVADAGSLENVLVDGKQVTLYLFEKDPKGKSECSGACAQVWPPLTTKGAPQASGAVSADELSTIKRSDGTEQVAYHGHPLYYYAPDGMQPGSAKGEGVNGFGAEWYAVGTNGEPVEDEGDEGDEDADSGTSSSGGGGGYSYGS